MKRIIVDIDETIADITTPWLAALHSVYDIHLTKSEINHYHLHLFYPDATLKDVLLIAKNHAVLEKAEPLPLVRLALNHCIKHNIEIIFLTARGWHPDGFRLTQTWLKKHALPYHQLHIMPMNMSKAVYAKQKFGLNMTAFFDDYTKNIDDFKKVLPSVKSFLITQPWNIHSDHQKTNSLYSALPFIL